MDTGWIGVDLDGTLAEYHGWKGIEHIGPPVPAMLARVKQWLAEGREVKIFTARISEPNMAKRILCRRAIRKWSLEHCGVRLDVTNEKDFRMTELWDDRAVQVEANTGRRIGDFDNPRFNVGETTEKQGMSAEKAMEELWGLLCPDCGPTNYEHILKEVIKVVA